MAAGISYFPNAIVVLVKQLPTALGNTFRFDGLYSMDARNYSGAQVGTCALTFVDPDEHITENAANTPQPMDVLVVGVKNRFKEWHIAWTGRIDKASNIYDPKQGKIYSILATTIYKDFEITRQTAGDAASIAVGEMSNLKGSAILTYAAKMVGYPGPLKQLPFIMKQVPEFANDPYPAGHPGLIIDPNAVSGESTWGQIDNSIFTDPTQQTWSQVLQSVATSAGLELFVNRFGSVIYRRIGYLNINETTLNVMPEDVLYLEHATNDDTVVTRVEVRYGVVPLIQTQGKVTGIWEAPQSMVDAYHARNVVQYDSWIINPDAASFLAASLGQQYAANVLQGICIIPLNARYEVGNVVAIPLNPATQSFAYYYISGINHVINGGEDAYTILTLAYGRDKDAQFPFLDGLSYPVLSKTGAQGVSQNTSIINLNSDGQGVSSTLFNAEAQGAGTGAALAAGTAATDPSLIPVGTGFYIQDKNGKILGKYTAVAGSPGTNIITSDNVSATGVQVKIYSLPQSGTTGSSDTSNGSGGGPGNSSGSGNGNTGNGNGNVVVNGLSTKALKIALAQQGKPYTEQADHTGPNAFDCSGLVYFSYTQAGYSASDWGYMVAGLQYYYFLSHGGVEITLAQAANGDLLLYGDMSDASNQHIGLWCNGSMYSAMNPSDGIGFCDVNSFHTEGGSGLTHVVRMSGVT